MSTSGKSRKRAKESEEDEAGVVEEAANGGDEYDDQEEEEGANRRLLRKNLRQLVGDVHDKGAELKTGSEDARRQTRELYEKAEDLAGAVKHPREYLVLAQVEAEIGSVVLAQVSRVDVSSHQDNPTEFAVKVKSWLAPPAERLDDEDHQGERVDDRAAERERWRALGALLPKFFAVAPGPSFLSGMVPTVAVVRERKAKAKDDLAKGPAQEIAEMEENQQDGDGANAQTIAQVDRLSRQLATLKQCPVMKLVANPKSMAQTVEHTFHLAFLVKDGRAEIFDDGSGQGPMVRLVDASRPHQQKQGKSDDDRVQAVLRLDTKMLKQVTDKFSITTPMITRQAK